MKICILSNALSVHTQRWAAAFADQGHEVHVLSIRKAEIKGVFVHTVNVGPVNATSAVLTLLSYLYLLLTARYRIKKLKPDIVNAHYAMTHGLIAAFSKVHPLVVTVWGSDIIHGDGSKVPFIKSLFLKYVFSGTDIITGASEYLIEQVKRVLNCQRQIVKVAFGVNVSGFRPTHQKNKQNVKKIGFAKSFKKKYGPDLLVKAFKKINQKHPDTKLVIAGDGPMRRELENMAMEMGVSDKVEFVGFLNKDDLIHHFNSLDIFVHSSVCQESFGVAVLEASACGVPVVATNVGGVPEVCIEGKTGFLVPPNDPDAIAVAVNQLIQNEQLRREFGDNGRIFVVEKYSWSDCVAKMLALFEELVQRAK